MKKVKDLLYCSGNIAACLSAVVFSTYITFFYVDTLKMPAELIGIGMGIYGIWNAINDPLFGQLSDKTRTRWGRRIPYILFGSIPFAIAFTFVWIPPTNLLKTTTSMFIYFMIAIFLYDGLYTLVVLNWTALFPEMYKTQEERTKISGIRQAFGIIGNILGVALPPIIYTAIGWVPMGILFGVITGISLMVSIAGAKEDPASMHEEGLPIGKAIAATYKNKSFLTYVFGAMLLQFTFVMLEAGIPFYAKYVLKITDNYKVSLMLGSIFVVAIIFVGIWAKVANKKGSKFTIILCSILYGIALIPFLFVNTFTGGLITAMLAGVGLAGILTLMDVMISDIVDEDEIKTGVRREGMYFGVNGFMIRLGVSVQSVLLGFVLKMSGYNAKLPVNAQPQSALFGMRMLVTIVPIIAIIFAVIIFKFYPLHGETLKKVKQKVFEIHG